MKEGLPDDDKYFIRPVKDLKEFTGLVVKYKDIAEWKFIFIIVSYFIPVLRQSRFPETEQSVTFVS